MQGTDISEFTNCSNGWSLLISIKSIQKSTMKSSVWYFNSNNTYRLLLAILLSGQVETNPGPDIDYPCGICNNEVDDNDQALQCDSCNFWCHINCCGVSDDYYVPMYLVQYYI